MDEAQALLDKMIAARAKDILDLVKEGWTLSKACDFTRQQTMLSDTSWQKVLKKVTNEN